MPRKPEISISRNGDGSAHARVADVLIVDDHPIIVEGLRNIIDAHEQLRVCATARSAAEARRKISQYQPGVVVLDLSLRDSDGLEMIPEILAGGVSTVVVYSQFASSERRNRALDLGASAFVDKSELGAALVQTIASFYEDVVARA